MKVTQPNSRTVRVLSDTGVSFLIPYRIFWNGHDRPAESIVLSAGQGRSKEARGSSEVRAFFLFGEIRDRISSDATGIILHRNWSVKTPGLVHLSIDLVLDAPKDLRCLFPGVREVQGVPDKPMSFMGEKTSYPASLYLAMGKKGLLLFSRTAACEGSAGSIGISRNEIEDEPPRLQVEVRFPGIEEPFVRVGPGPEHREEPVDTAIESPGSLEREHEVYLAFSSSQEIHLHGASAAFSRLLPAAQPPAAQKKAAGPADTACLADALRATVSTHLWQKGGMVGVREVPGSPWISATAGLGLAVAMRRLFPSDARLQELALRLADSSLKGQLPSGFFHESFHTGEGIWRGVRGQTRQTLLSVAQSSRIAELLLLLDDDLARDGLPHEKYYLAGLRFVEFFLDGKARLRMPGGLQRPGDPTPTLPSDLQLGGPRLGGSQLGGLELFFPMARVCARTGRDRYKKALDDLARRFSAIPWDAFHPPGSRDGRGPDWAGALLAARLFIEMRAMGYKPAEAPAGTAAAAKMRAAESAALFASLLVPWIRVHPTAEGPGSAETWAGCVIESFTRQRLLFAGYETALLLLRIAELSPAGGKPLLKGLARLCLAGARKAPLGAGFVQHARWDAEGRPEQGRGKIGPVDSRRLASEILAGLRIVEEYPVI